MRERRFFVVLFALAGFLFGGGVSHAAGDDLEACEHGTGKAAIRGCTRVINSSREVGQQISVVNLAKAHNIRGNAYEELGLPDRAIKDFDRATTLYPKYAPAYFNRGMIFKSARQFERAIREFETALRLDPKHDEAFRVLLSMFEESEQTERLYDLVERYSETKPGAAARIFHSRGYNLASSGDMETALSFWLRAADLRQKNPDIRASLGMGFFLVGEEETAIAEWKEACKLASKKKIVAWQSNLSDRNIYAGKVDGVCGPGTIESFKLCAKGKCKL